MIDKFMQLTNKILKILSIGYTMSHRVHVAGDNRLTHDIYNISYKSSDPIMTGLRGLIEIHDIQPDDDVSHISISAFTHIEESRDLLKNLFSKDIMNITFDYMNTINHIFNLGEQHTRDYDGVLYAYIISDDINSSIIDEFLAYDDEEFKLYVNLL